MIKCELPKTLNPKKTGNLNQNNEKTLNFEQKSLKNLEF